MTAIDVIKAFYEAWCPSTNTLPTSFGELCISLWDLHTLAGLPMTGLIRATKYCKPPPRKEKRTVHPKSNHNPSETFGVHGKLLTADEALLLKLGIEGSLKEETLWVAYLACPSAFKVASIMAVGQKVGLGVPVLASIYKGLDKDGTRYWHLCTLSKIMENVWFPSMPPNAKKLSPKAYKTWWAETHGGFFEENVATFLASSLSKVPPKYKEHGKEVVQDAPHEHIVSLSPKCNSRVVELIEGLVERQLKEANTRLQDAKVKESEEVPKIQSTMNELERIEKELVDLKEQRMTLCSTLKGQKQFLHNAQAEAHEIESETAAPEITTPLDDNAVKNLESSRANLEVLKKELENVTPFA
ncbi:UNVERIFIED_CONTAM: hypothetical protein Scaly_2831000 [Sesamum calycinum]|uniref:Aminotransferase-like plant mobile domain-containing protein n=1 Tax=Sesamum calycinum TaxID=2727403 RepID=A0AAW2ISI4_9LAMI